MWQREEDEVLPDDVLALGIEDVLRAVIALQRQVDKISRRLEG
jgi:hypothetical protein